MWNYCNSIVNHEKILEIQWQEYCSWDTIKLPLVKIEQEPILKKIDSKHTIKGIAIIRTKPYFCYRWHKDLTRGPTINMIISEKLDSKCLFGLDSSKDQSLTSKGGMDLGSSNMINFIELNYIPKNFYIFNTQVLHTLINYSMVRYLFTVEFLEDNTKLSYHDLFNWLSKENLLEPS
jgi:hypothetical protein